MFFGLTSFVSPKKVYRLTVDDDCETEISLFRDTGLQVFFLNEGAKKAILNLFPSFEPFRSTQGFHFGPFQKCSRTPQWLKTAVILGL